MTSVFDSYVGAKTESTYGTPVVVDKFFEVTSVGVSGVYERIESQGIRAGAQGLRTDRWTVNPKGAEGDVEMNVLTRDAGFWLLHALGGLSSGTPSGGVTAHTFTLGNTAARSLTLQKAQPLNDGTLIPMTYAGGKVTEWSLSNSVDEVLSLSVSLDFATANEAAGAGALALQTPSYTSGSELLTSNNGVITIGGETVVVTDISINGSNGLATDRFGIGGVKSAPSENELKEVTFECTTHFTSAAHFNRVRSATEAGAMAEIVATWTRGNSSVQVTIPHARFDEGSLELSTGDRVSDLSVSGKALDGGTGLVTVVYTTADETIA
jgi:hypothetical protein